MTTNKHAIQTYKSLLLRDVCDDVIDMIADFVGDFKETPSDLANKWLMLPVEQRYKTSDGQLIHSDKVGHYCCLCKDFYEYKTQKGLARHTNSLKHQKNFSKYHCSSKKIAFDVGDILDVSSKKYCKYLIEKATDFHLLVFKEIKKQLYVLEN